MANTARSSSFLRVLSYPCDPCNPWFSCFSYEVGGRRLAGFRGVSRRALPAVAGFQPPLPEPDWHLSAHPALQQIGVSSCRLLASHLPSRLLLRPAWPPLPCGRLSRPLTTTGPLLP